ncbi:MAG TPA: Rap1a/Tai family immunity protein [Sphingomicrobium sp.]|nr:Rap1a/Tai family immunity protein [Sphingomicrobium sp.]
MFATGLLAFLAAGASQATQAPVIPAFFTGERLYEICTEENTPRCWMYVAGVLDGVFAAETGADNRSICAARLTNRDAAERVIGFLRDNPAFRSKAAAVGVKAALRADLPCATNQLAKSEH